MDNKDNTANQTLSSSQCAAGCGFFGHPQFDGMCSQCFKRKQSANEAANNLRVRSATPPSSSSTLSSTVESPLSASITTASPVSEAAVPTIKTSDSSSTVSLPRQPDTLTDKSSSSEEASASEPAAAKSGQESPSLEKPAEAASSPSDELDKKTKKRNRCGTCKKKVGLTGFDCRCGGLYCGLHRYSDKHNCQYDYKKEGEETIRKNNPLVVGAKLQKI